MGVIYKAICSCGYETTLELESGLNTYNYNFVKRLLDKSDEEIFTKAYQNDFIDHFELTNVAYRCNECSTIGTIFQLKYHLKSGEEVIVHGKCKKCNKPVEVIEIKHIACPKCGEKMKLDMVGHWD
jgi:hypothetical protein